MERKIEIISNWNLNSLFGEMQNGNIKIPRFQRDYVWELPKVVALLNSIYKQYPIGSFFVWVTGLDHLSFCRPMPGLNLPESPANNQIFFILDGQQRATSLYVALNNITVGNKAYGDICFNLEQEIFLHPKQKNNPLNIPAWKLFDTNEYSETLTKFAIQDLNNGTSHQKTWTNCWKIFNDYPISVIKTLKTELDEVVEIFERINQGGKRLTLFDLVHAGTWAKDFDLKEKIKTFNESAAVRAFGKIEGEVFTQSLALNVYANCLKNTQLNLTADACKAAWKDTEKYIGLAIDFVKGLGVPFIDFLPYSSLLPIIQYYFFAGKTSLVKPAHKIAIQDWFWSAAFSQRFSSSSLTRMKEDADWILKLATGAEAGEKIFAVKLQASDLIQTRMNTSSAIKSALLCLMASKQPRDFNNSTRVILDRSNVSRSQSRQNHHFFPFSLRNEFGATEKEINSVVNFALISAALNQQISAKYPADYLTEYQNGNSQFSEDLRTHLIDDNALAAAKHNDFQAFIKTRADALLQEVYRVCKERNSLMVTSATEESTPKEQQETE